ncbi:MAG: hypothetical protein IJL87_01930 [Clostridia bacterium]|nr:hypothetical protein [Clostridia bacterium]
MADENKRDEIHLQKIRASIERTKKFKLHAKQVLKLTGIAILLLFAIVFFQNRSDLTWNGFKNWVSDKIALAGIGQGYPVTITGGYSKAIDTFGDAIIELTDTSFVVLDSTGKTAASRQHGFASPAISSTDRYALLYDTNGTNFRIESVSRTVYSASADGQILSASLSKSGCYALITKDSSYLGAVYVYDKKHNPLLEWKSAFHQLQSVSVSPNGKHTAITGITTENGQIKSCVMVFNYISKEDTKTFEFYDSMLLDCEFVTSDYLSVVGDTASYVIDIRNGKYVQIDYDGSSLAGFDFDQNYGTVLLLSKFDDLRNCDILFADEAGKIISRTHTNLKGGFIKLKGKNAYTVSNNRLYRYHNNGKLKNEIEVGSNIKQCAVLGNSAYLLGTSKIKKISL